MVESYHEVREKSQGRSLYMVEKGSVAMCSKNFLTVVLVGIVGLSTISCDERADARTLAVTVQGDDWAKAAVEEYLSKNPIVISGTEYSMRVVEPNPNLDYKTIVVEPDPNVEYKITVVDPTSGIRVPKLSSELGDPIRKALQDKRKKKE